MDQIKNLLELRKKYLLNLIEEKENALATAPEGTLRLNKQGNHVHYYHRMNPKDITGKYLRKKEEHIASALAQKDYDYKILQACRKELAAIQNYNACYPLNNAEAIYETLHKERQKLIHPISETDEQFIEKWKSVKYKGKNFDQSAPEFYTADGERVRSKSEVIIADLLHRENIPYRYEYPLLLDNSRKIYPDFTLLHIKKRKEIYLEHLGKMDDPEYVEKALLKINSYERNGIYPGENLILTHETLLNPLNQKSLMNKIKHYFQ